MQRPLRALATGLVMILAGCGGTDYNTVVSTPPSTSATPTHAVVATTAERPYVDAMVASAAASDTSADFTAALARCVSTAIVRGYGVDAFKSSGITPNGLRNPDSTLDALPDPTDAQVTDVGVALQGCKLAKSVAAGLGQGLGVTAAPSIACLTKQVASGPDARRFIVLSVLERKVDLQAAHSLIGLVASCVDLADVVLRAAKVPIDPATRTCLVDALHGSDAQLKDFLALRMAGADPDTAEQASEQLSVALNRCRPSAHTGFTVPSG
jgi:hypothetical protein